VHLGDLWLAMLPPVTIHLVVGRAVGLESTGSALPGEITIVGRPRRRARRAAALEPAA
jgi:hypothetical protein